MVLLPCKQPQLGKNKKHRDEHDVVREGADRRYLIIRSPPYRVEYRKPNDQIVNVTARYHRCKVRVELVLERQGGTAPHLLQRYFTNLARRQSSEQEKRKRDIGIKSG